MSPVTVLTTIPSVANKFMLQNQPIGYLMSAISLLFTLLYIPCGIVLWQPKQFKNSCYKIMACMAIVDIFNLIIGGFITGCVSVVGISPSFLDSEINKTWGIFVCFAWYAYGSLSVVLAVNRCVHLKYENLSADLFGGRRIYYWIIGCAVYSIPVPILLLTPIAGLPYYPQYCVYNFVGYATIVISVHNWGISIILPIIHLFQYRYLRQRMSASSNQEQLNVHERRLVYQGTAICMSTALCAISYLTFPHFIDPDHIWIVQLFWLWDQGGNSVIYLTMNKTIRRKVGSFFGMSCGLNSVVPLTTTVETK